MRRLERRQNAFQCGRRLKRSQRLRVRHVRVLGIGRAEYAHVSDTEALGAFQTPAALEGILPALESAHAIAYARKLAPELGSSAVLLINLSGRADKDVQTVEKAV